LRTSNVTSRYEKQEVAICQLVGIRCKEVGEKILKNALKLMHFKLRFSEKGKGRTPTLRCKHKPFPLIPCPPPPENYQFAPPVTLGHLMTLILILLAQSIQGPKNIQHAAKFKLVK